jgi:hypothetical protein
VNSALELIRYATGNGFWVFVGVVIILMVIGEAIAGAVKLAALAIAGAITSTTSR